MVLYFRRRLRIKYTLAVVGLISVVYIIYQIKSVQELTNKSPLRKSFVRGVHYAMIKHYYADDNDQFTCLNDGELIAFNKVNDDYCDCKDGTDEPGTDACPNGKFYCEYDMYKRNAIPLPSGKVNDGICDCCDGSDEWKKIVPPFKFSDRVQKQLGTFLSPCSYIC